MSKEIILQERGAVYWCSQCHTRYDNTVSNHCPVHGNEMNFIGTKYTVLEEKYDSRY